MRLQKDNLLEDIDLYRNTTSTIVVAMLPPSFYLLNEHVERLLDRYGVIGFFSEDAMESIHVIVNALARRYTALDATRKVKQVNRALESRKQNSVTIAKTKADECKPTKKGSRRQGAKRDGCASTSTSTIEIADDKKHDVAVVKEQIGSADAEHTYLS
jgi:hypothetical protein